METPAAPPASEDPQVNEGFSESAEDTQIVGTPEPEQGEEQEPDTFPRSVVEKLRKENASYRDRAKQADALAERLHAALVTGTGKLADPTDLPYDPEHLDNPEALDAAIADLLTRKPHLASRKPVGDINQGARPSASGDVNLLAMMRGGL
ncbi:hypothetical protein H0264_21390 [Nocardia huaxiensis]|uniref:Uncharacterized protein n=1 Tax=Nocardia huaxiensis TaxID=2755382 RepID=A0A7D6VEK4_9NOCA|nr:hypothetical protein H0264_21390 [Nocardia huaxiensis]